MGNDIFLWTWPLAIKTWLLCPSLRNFVGIFLLMEWRSLITVLSLAIGEPYSPFSWLLKQTVACHWSFTILSQLPCHFPITAGISALTFGPVTLIPYQIYSEEMFFPTLPFYLIPMFITYYHLFPTCNIDTFYILFPRIFHSCLYTSELLHKLFYVSVLTL